MDIIIPALEQSALFFPLALGIYLSYGILRTTDLTIDGSFVLGAAVFARLLTGGMNPWMSLLVAILAGFLAGIGVSFIQKGGRINGLIAGVLALFILYSVNFQVMSRPNISLYNAQSLFAPALNLGESGQWIMLIALVMLILIFIAFLLKTRLGLVLRAFGDNPYLLKNIGKSIEGYRFFGLALANGLAACCGALSAQIHGYADINMGFGVTLTGIGAVVIGQQLMKRFTTNRPFSVTLDLTGCFIGVFLYFLMINIFLRVGIDPINLKLVLGLVLIFFLRAASSRQQGMLYGS